MVHGTFRPSFPEHTHDGVLSGFGDNGDDPGGSVPGLNLDRVTVKPAIIQSYENLASAGDQA